jgi:hypothetical protein
MNAPACKASWTVTVITETQQFTPYEGKSEQFARHDLVTARHAILITGGVALINLRKNGALVESTNVYKGQYITQAFTDPREGGAR